MHANPHLLKRPQTSLEPLVLIQVTRRLHYCRKGIRRIIENFHSFVHFIHFLRRLEALQVEGLLKVKSGSKQGDSSPDQGHWFVQHVPKAIATQKTKSEISENGNKLHVTSFVFRHLIHFSLVRRCSVVEKHRVRKVQSAIDVSAERCISLKNLNSLFQCLLVQFCLEKYQSHHPTNKLFETNEEADGCYRNQHDRLILVCEKLVEYCQCIVEPFTPHFRWLLLDEEPLCV
mmetsp:Transcript_13288/g.33679  ORF Transcript_13288/g.33679 Transcript_13288/m.33679 type:complete len:231 (+) Transcript_13288:2568-3260(+)